MHARRSPIPDICIRATGELRLVSTVAPREGCSPPPPSNLDRFRRVLETHNLTQVVCEPTRDTAILDLIFTNRSDLISSVQCLEPFCQSDHRTIEARIQMPRSSSVLLTRPPLRNYRAVDWLCFSHLLSLLDWSSFWMVNDIDRCWLEFKTNVLQILDICVPPQLPCVLPRSRKKPPWLTGTINLLRKHKSHLWAAYTKHPDVDALQQYRRTRNQLTATIRAAQSQYEETIAEQCASNPHTFFTYANTHRSVHSQIPNLRLPDGGVTTNLSAIALTLNNHFVSVFTPESSVVLPPTLPTVPDLIATVPDLYRFDLHTVRFRLLKLNANKAVGPDGIHNVVLKNSSYTIAPLLTALFQKSLDSGVVPEDWKAANVTPIHKSGPLDFAANYRPISLTSCVCKLMERFIYDWVYDFLTLHAPIRASQHGFQRGQSCASQLLEYCNDVTVALDRKCCVDVIYLDFSKAFDKVSHSLLLHKLRCRQIPNRLVRWIESFLLNRKQRVVLGEEFSEWAPVTSGVPQGSVLGPLLFNLFVDDIDEVLDPAVTIKKFADDTKLYISYPPCDAAAAAAKLQASLNSLSIWCSQWCMQLNAAKCSALYFGDQNLVFSYSLNNHSLVRLTSVRDLGVIVTDCGSVSEQCRTAAAAARRLTGLMLRTFKSRKPSVLLPVFKTIIRPLVEYATPVWNPCLKRDIAELENVQRKVTKRIAGFRNLPYSTRLERLQLPSLEMRRLYFDLLECYKIVHGLVRSDCRASLTLSNHNTRGNNCMLDTNLPPARLNVRKYSFVERVLTHWNALPVEILRQSTLGHFKLALRNHLHV